MDVRELTASEIQAQIIPLAGILSDCVADGASVNFMRGYSVEDATSYWNQIATKSAANDLIVFGAFINGVLVGTATLITRTPPNQPHRAEVAKVLVSPKYQRRGVAKALMLEIERTAMEIGKDLLVLDTLTGSAAESLYASLGWIRVGEIPRYALTPNGVAKATMVFYKDLSNK